jgi:hypothetical protein
MTDETGQAEELMTAASAGWGDQSPGGHQSTRGRC